MIEVKYPECVEAQLEILDEKIEEIYRGYEGLKEVSPDEAMWIKRIVYEQTKPFMGEKVRLITYCFPTYTVNGAITGGRLEESGQAESEG